MDLKFYTNMAKGFKVKVKVLGANSNVSRSFRGKTGRAGPSRIGLNWNKKPLEIGHEY